MLSWPSKDPNEVLDYQVNWGSRLETGETIVTSEFSVVDGDVEIQTPTPDPVGAKCTVWLTGGTDGTTAEVLNRITTSVGRTYDQTVKLRIRGH